MAKQQVNSAQIKNVPVKRNNNGTIVNEIANIQSGWVIIPISSTTANVSVTITFPSAFTNVPIVMATYGGDTVGATSTLGAGGPNVQGAVAEARSVTTTNVLLTAGTLNGANNWVSGNTIYIHWIAIGA